MAALGLVPSQAEERALGKAPLLTLEAAAEQKQEQGHGGWGAGGGEACAPTPSPHPSLTGSEAYPGFSSPPASTLTQNRDFCFVLSSYLESQQTDTISHSIFPVIARDPALTSKTVALNPILPFIGHMAPISSLISQSLSSFVKCG